MIGQTMWLRCREVLVALRAGITLRRVGRACLVAGVLGSMAIAVEAMVRAHIPSADARMPTALYTRAIPWRGGDDRDDKRPPVAIGTIDGAPLEDRIPVRLRDVPDQLIQAILAVEDQRFYQHHGLDLRRIGGAMLANLRAGTIVQGGSTLTQQLAKNLFLSADRTPLRKLREAAMAVVLELRYNKATILDAYLNEIYLGQDGAHAIHGVGAAARYYLGKDVRRVTLAESAQLAAMISAPNRSVASRHPEVARQRRDLVLQLMLEQHRITQAAAEHASSVDVTAGAHATPTIDGRYFRDFVATNLDRHLPARGAAVYTTLDAVLQHAAERAVANGLNRLPARGAEAALVAIDPRNGEVLAMVGGRDYAASQFNRATVARRQPGSAFKPVVALAALERRHDGSPDFTLASVLDDAPLRVETAHGPWEPADYDQEFRGPVTFREAMEQSLNVPFARVGLVVGADTIANMARRIGITSALQAVPSLALGTSEVTLLELVRAYGVLADSGRLAATRTVLGRRDSRSEEHDTTVKVTQVVDPAVAYLVTSMLEGVVTRGTGRALNEDGQLGAVAGKTGTSSDWRDAWFVAYSSSVVVGVWVGFDDGQSLRAPGATDALPIVASFLAQITPSGGWQPFAVPDGIAEGDGGSADESDPLTCGTREVFLEGTQPAQGACDESVDVRPLHRVDDWGAALKQRVARMIQRLIASHSDRHGSWRGLVQ